MSHDISRRLHPILKRDSSPFKTPVLPFTSRAGLFSPHVHFPPTPRIADTYPAHSPTTYDRKPIIVSPNLVQLPRRGERKLHTPPIDVEPEHRGRSRSRIRGRATTKGSYFHPRAYEACDIEPEDAPSSRFDLPSLPSLVKDLSPSDESDDVVTPPGMTHPTVAHAIPLRFPDSSPQLSSIKPSRRPRSNKIQRADLTRHERLRDESLFSCSNFSPSPKFDEGCLGGF